jgi:hypothetical protein
MHKRLQELTDYVAGVRAELTDWVHATAPEALLRTPGEGKWSATQVIQHLGKVEGSVTKALEGMFAQALAEGFPADPADSSVLGALDKYRVVDRSGRRLDAPPPFHPDAIPDFDANWNSLLAVRQQTLAAYGTVDGRDLTRIAFPHPFFGPLNAYEWLLLVGQHERRHLDQMQEAAAP